MKFSVLVSIVAEELEDKAIKLAKETGAGGVTHLKGRGLGLKEKKTFLGLSYERNESILIFILEKKLSLKVMKNLTNGLDLNNDGHGIVFSMPIEHIAGINLKQIMQFQDNIKEDF